VDAPTVQNQAGGLARSVLGDNAAMKLRFTKMHGAGNDFVLLDGVRHYRALASRHFGVGADQILIVEPPPTQAAATVDFSYRIINADGQEVEQCGNGARCFLRFTLDQGLSTKTTLRVQTANGVIEPSLQADGRVRVDMGRPNFVLDEIVFDVQGLQHRGHNRLASQWLIHEPAISQPLWVSAVSMGNPHLVMVVANTATAPVHDVGPWLETHARVPMRANIGFMQVLNRGQISLRVWERGAGETLACGTGACAAVVSGIGLGLLDNSVEVTTRGGALRIDWDGGGSVWLTGPTEHVFDGEMDMAQLDRQAALV
jgi:diaminopimelate epimerase